MKMKMIVHRLVRTSISFGEASYLHKQIRNELEGQKKYVNYLKRRNGKRYAKSLDKEGRTMMKRQRRDAEKRVTELTTVAERIGGRVSRLETSDRKSTRLELQSPDHLVCRL